VTGHASLSGTGVVLYNAGRDFCKSDDDRGGITLSGNGTFNLTAPASGPYAGVVIFQARDNTRAISLSRNAMAGLGGTLYAPAALLYLTGDASLRAALVVNELSLSGDAASTQAADSADVSGGNAAGQLLAGDVVVYVNDPNSLFTADELARIQDAVSAVDAVVEPFGVSVTETTDSTAANVVIDTGSSSTVGGYADGILGCYTTAGEITLIQGWDWYAGSDPSQIGASQYDFQTTVTHELGHALGLGESSDSTSAMSGTLAPGTVIRTLTTADLNIPYDEGLADPQRAAVPPPMGAVNNPVAVAITPPVQGAAPGLLTTHAATGGNVFGVEPADFPGESGIRFGLQDGRQNEVPAGTGSTSAWAPPRIEGSTAPGGLPAPVGGWLRSDIPADDGDDMLPGDDLWVGGLAARRNEAQDGLGAETWLTANGESRTTGADSPDTLSARAVDDYFLLGDSGAADRTCDLATPEAMLPQDTDLGDAP